MKFKSRQIKNYPSEITFRLGGRLQSCLSTCFALTAMKTIVPSGVIATEHGVSVTAVTSLDNEVFVIRYNSQVVEVYDTTTFAFQRNITVDGLGTLTSGMTACARSKYLYLSDFYDDRIYGVLSCNNTVVTWSETETCGCGPAGLSVNNARNLIVVCYLDYKLQEYTTKTQERSIHFIHVRDICLPAGMTLPWHAVQLSSGDFVVSQCMREGVVSVVRIDGQVVESYGQSETSDVREMRYPTSLAVTKNDDILVADSDNNRILSINRSTGCVQKLALLPDGGIRNPQGLCLVQKGGSQGRLYVGEWLEEYQCRVLVFDGVTATP